MKENQILGCLALPFIIVLIGLAYIGWLAITQ